MDISISSFEIITTRGELACAKALFWSKLNDACLNLLEPRPGNKVKLWYKFVVLLLQKTTTLDIPSLIKPDNLSVNKICISEPDDCNPKTPLTPEITDRTPDEKVNKNQLTPTITEENEQDDQSVSHKSCLSLPVEAPSVGPVERDRRKLSVQGLMAFAERRRSSSTFSDMRKMSISNGDSIHMRSPGGTGKTYV